jgi:hypothetical protein
VTLCAVLTGCPGEDKCGDATDNPCNPPPDETETGLVLTQQDAFYTRRGVERRPRDFSAMPVEVIPAEGGTPVSGTVVEPGRVRFDVPPGSYLVKNSATQYILTSARALDISGRRVGRPDRGGNPFPSPLSTPASLNVSGLEPVPAFSSPLLYFNSLDVEESGSFFTVAGLPSGQTSLVDPNAEYYSDWGSIPRFDAGQGDTAWVLQQVERDAGTPQGASRPWKYSAVTRAARMDPFSFDGEKMNIQATLQPLPALQLRFDLRRDEFNALRLASTQGAPAASMSLDVLPGMKDPQEGWIDYSISQLLVFVPPRNDAQTPLTREFTYANPYPSPWEPVAQFLLTYSFDITRHDGSRSIRTSESFFTVEPASSVASTPVRPQISLPRDFKVDGQSAQTARMLGTLTPLVTWEPPAVGTATAYTLRIDSSTPGTNTLSLVARFYTGPDERSVRLPPGVLKAGTDYVLRITAHHAPGRTPEQTWFATAIPYASAATASSLLTTP